ncbi:hypothetical protein VNO80_08749 [Phaseolus coccineus]|uniref:Uncharacterized protein n=1 Tax=Phaseolus coccineus TaxID=3886 RepID=A0AAN9RC09_PHACN
MLHSLCFCIFELDLWHYAIALDVKSIYTVIHNALLSSRKWESLFVTPNRTEYFTENGCSKDSQSFLYVNIQKSNDTGNQFVQ